MCWLNSSTYLHFQVKLTVEICIVKQKVCRGILEIRDGFNCGSSQRHSTKIFAGTRENIGGNLGHISISFQIFLFIAAGGGTSYWLSSSVSQDS